MTQRGQALTLEAVLATLILIGAVVFALQASALTPVSFSSTNEHLDTQRMEIGAGTLQAANENGTIEPTVLYWDNSTATFHGASIDGYQYVGPPTPFGEQLNASIGNQSMDYEVKIYYLTPANQRRSIVMVEGGTPPSDAATIDRIITVHDEDRLYNDTLIQNGPTLENSSYFAPDMSPETGIYNVMIVEVTIW